MYKVCGGLTVKKVWLRHYTVVNYVRWSVYGKQACVDQGL